MNLKQKIFSHYLHLLDEKINAIQQVLNDLKESASNETKSTAGDKHETALAMLQIEQANTRAQLKEVQDMKAVFERIDPSLSSSIIVNGSLIKTNKGLFFLSVAMGKAVVDGHAVIALSSQSPLGSKLMGLRPGESAVMNNNIYLVEAVE
jgi:hypothetical protein